MLELFLTVVVLMSTFKNKNSLRTIEAQNVQTLKTMRLGQNLLVLIKKKRVRALGVMCALKKV